MRVAAQHVRTAPANQRHHKTAFVEIPEGLNVHLEYGVGLQNLLHLRARTEMGVTVDMREHGHEAVTLTKVVNLLQHPVAERGVGQLQEDIRGVAQSELMDAGKTAQTVFYGDFRAKVDIGHGQIGVGDLREGVLTAL